MLHRFIVYFLLLFMLFTSAAMAKEDFISGQVIYTNEEVLPEKAKVEVVLEDISLMDTVSVIIGKTVIDPAGQIPISFKITFNDEKIQLGHRYAVRAKVTHDSKLLYITDTLNAVFAGTNDKNMHLIMKRIGKVPKSQVMEGMYKYLADAALFKDCITGKYYPVAFEGDNAALEKAYLEETNGSAAFIEVEVKARVVKRPKMEGEGEEGVLFIEEFIRLDSNADCTKQHASVPITNNYWKLTTLYAKSVKTEANDREAHILLREGLNGTGVLKVVTGCDTLLGDYKLDGNTVFLHLKALEKKRENCKNEVLEKNFLSALNSTAYWQIEDEKLTLFDEMDNTLATFQAIYF